MSGEDIDTSFNSGADLWASKIYAKSGLSVRKIESHSINVYKYKTVCCGGYIDLPKCFKNSKKGLINIQNNDDECFKCVILHIYIM